MENYIAMSDLAAEDIQLMRALALECVDVLVRDPFGPENPDRYSLR